MKLVAMCLTDLAVGKKGTKHLWCGAQSQTCELRDLIERPSRNSLLVCPGDAADLSTLVMAHCLYTATSLWHIFCKSNRQSPNLLTFARPNYLVMSDKIEVSGFLSFAACLRSLLMGHIAVPLALILK
ncbi:hypothetical protein M758_8G012300 [Ceratodon purpureus]|uniref:Uncharacterized protein n=1 Tax=Ceratodon purpureus TaxID=3225 RepID=A0A8T0GXD6_CERPU|nr:hypothetical protein KC19_8G012900 [Ceratodon purpureus]KAG0607240.1 hypothetical protein M758_8G012300 [Ceratodon purpureus]